MLTGIMWGLVVMLIGSRVWGSMFTANCWFGLLLLFCIVVGSCVRGSIRGVFSGCVSVGESVNNGQSGVDGVCVGVDSSLGSSKSSVNS